MHKNTKKSQTKSLLYYLFAFTIYFVVNLKFYKVEKVCILRHCMETETQIALKSIKYKYDIHAYLNFFFYKTEIKYEYRMDNNLMIHTGSVYMYLYVQRSVTLTYHANVVRPVHSSCSMGKRKPLKSLPGTYE